MNNEQRTPRTFTDTAGRVWRLSINVGSAMRVRAALGVDLLAPDTQQTILDLAGDPLTLCAVLWELVADQATAAGLDQQGFFDGLVDDSIEQATFAFLDALIDFFPKRRQGTLRRIVAKMREAGDKQLAHVEAKVEAGMLDQRIDREIARANAAIDKLLEPTDGS